MQYNDQTRCISNIITRFVCIYNKSAETLAVCPEKLWMPIPKGVHSQVGWGSEQVGLVEGVPVHDRWIGKDEL